MRNQTSQSKCSNTSGIFRRPDSPYYWTTIYQNGKAQRVSTKCRTKAAAFAAAAELERAAGDPLSHARNTKTLRQALIDLVDDRQLLAQSASKRGSMATAEFYLAKAELIKKHFGDAFLLRDVTAATLDEYVAARRKPTVDDKGKITKRGAKDSTIHKELTTIRAALAIQVRKGTFVADPRAIMPKVSGQSESVTRWLTPEEVLVLLSELAPDRAAQVAFSLATSAEWVALTNATRADVDGDYVHVRGTKRSTRNRRIPIALPWQQKLMAFALANASEKRLNAPLFPRWLHSNSIRDLHAACERAKIKPCSWNDLRRTCCQWLVQDGVRIELAAVVLGQADKRMVSRVYGKLSPESLHAQLLACVPERVKYVQDNPQSFGSDGVPGKTEGSDPLEKASESVLRARIELATRGFSVLRSFSERLGNLQASTRAKHVSVQNACKGGVV
jgi:integrase